MNSTDLSNFKMKKGITLLTRKQTALCFTQPESAQAVGVITLFICLLFSKEFSLEISLQPIKVNSMQVMALRTPTATTVAVTQVQIYRPLKSLRNRFKLQLQEWLKEASLNSR